MTDADRGAGLSQAAAESAETVRHRYDDWTLSYEDDVRSWGYTLPEDLATRLVADYVGGLVLDAGCGTGLIGHALRDRGIESLDLIGTDLAPGPLSVAAETGTYRSLIRADLTRPLPFRDDTFGGVACGGVLTYLPDTEFVLRELVRVAFDGAPVIVSQRTDLWAERDMDDVVEHLRADGIEVDVADPLPYLPGLAEYGTEIEVIFVRLTTRSG